MEHFVGKSCRAKLIC